MKQLFCLTYAGGTAAFFQDFFGYISEEFECIALEYAGHGKRRAEPLYASFDEMVMDMTSQINACLTPESVYGIFGYSMGSLVAYEIIARGQLRHTPCCLFAAAHYAPSVSSVGGGFSALSDELLVERLKAFGGIPEQLTGDRRFWPMYLPTIRNDYRLLEMYGFMDKKALIEQDLTVFYSDDDTPFSFIAPWEKITSCSSRFYRMSGTHFFLHEHGAEIARIIEKRIEKGNLED